MGSVKQQNMPAPLVPGDTKKPPPNLVLDLDNTVVSAVPTEEFPFDNKKIISPLAKLTLHNMDDYYMVYERPGLQSFLDYIFKNFRVSVWTAASKDYAAFIIDKILLPKDKSNRKLHWVFCSYHGKLSHKKYKTPKQLKIFWEEWKLPGFNEKNTIIFDDHPGVKSSQHEIAVHVPDFEVLEKDSADDSYLLQAKKDLQSYLKEYNMADGQVENPSRFFSRQQQIEGGE